MKTLSVLILILCLNLFAVAQQSILRGTIYDASGAVIPKAKVFARGKTGRSFETETNEAGIYELTLPHANFDAEVAKYEITVEAENRGFKRKIIEDFAFIPAATGKMLLDIALEALDPEPCGYGGAGCLRESPIDPERTKPSNWVLTKPLEKSPKTKSIKRKNK